MKHICSASTRPDGDPPPPEVLGPIMAGPSLESTSSRRSWVFTADCTRPARPPWCVTDGDTLITDAPLPRARSTWRVHDRAAAHLDPPSSPHANSRP